MGVKQEKIQAMKMKILEEARCLARAESSCPSFFCFPDKRVREHYTNRIVRFTKLLMEMEHLDDLLE